MNFLKDAKTFGPTIGLKTIVVDIEEKGFNSFAENLIKLLVNKTNKICIGNIMICSDIWHKYHE